MNLMKNWIKKLLGVDQLEHLQKELQQLKEQVDQKENVNASLSSLNKDLESQIQTLSQQVDKRKENLESREPWIEIISDKFDPNQGIQIALDWNEAFIEYLKEAGFQGTNDEEVVRLYLAFLYRDIIEKFEARQQTEKEQLTRPTIKDE